MSEQFFFKIGRVPVVDNFTYDLKAFGDPKNGDT